jgi:hypothetical protein
MESMEDRTSRNLKSETEKWLAKLENERPLVQASPGDNVMQKAAQSALRNMDAYIKDTRHFMGKGDMVRAFEAVVYAWGILETCERLGLVERKK